MVTASRPREARPLFPAQAINARAPPASLTPTKYGRNALMCLMPQQTSSSNPGSQLCRGPKRRQHIHLLESPAQTGLTAASTALLCPCFSLPLELLHLCCLYWLHFPLSLVKVGILRG